MSGTDTDPDTPDWGSSEPALYPVIAAGASMFGRLLADVRVTGRHHVPATGPVLLAANHPSYVESVVTAGVVLRIGRRPRFLVLSSLFEHPVAGPVLRSTRMIPVHRGRGTELMVSQATQALAAGEALVVYPEGRLVPPGDEAPARPGAGLLALVGPGPVVPLASAGLGSFWWRLRRPAQVVIGEPVDLSAWRGRRDRQAQLEASAAILARIRRLEGQAQARLAGVTGGHGR